jgi:ferredoxin-NADP reductase
VSSEQTTSPSYDVVVTECRHEAPDIMSLSLASSDGAPLPPWTAGAHLDVRLPSGTVRQYSLCGGDDHSYLIAVLREAEGRGGSIELHETARPGLVLSVRGPRNRFPLTTADDYLLLAGGIGITPILAMARHLSATGKPWRLFYGGRSRSTMAFVDDLTALPGEINIVPESERGRLDLPSILAAAAPGTAIYCCGPPPMIAATEACCRELGFHSNVHTEQFTPAVDREPTAGTSPSAFAVKLHRSGQIVTVSPEQSILSAVRAILPDVPSSCEDGYCGTCETVVLDGVPEHRDDFLSDEERDSNETMMICVGRSKTSLLVLDL